MSPPPQVYTVAEVIALASSLTPANAVYNGTIDDAHCVTPLIEAVEVDGSVKVLKTVRDVGGVERYGGGYPRVSTLAQQVEGFSIGDQIKNIVSEFVDKGLAFRIFSDAGLSGSLPYNDRNLIVRMIEAKKELYRSVFTRIFLSPIRLQRYSTAQEKSVRDYLGQKMEKLDKGNPDAEDPTERLDTRPKVKQKLTFRPGLTRLMQHLPYLHTVVVSDLTRLSRNQYLFAEITRNFQRHQTKVVGVMERLDFLNKTADEGFDIGPEIQAWFLSKMAEMRLRETVLGDIRGLLERLEQGKPVGSKPWWIQSVADGPDKDKAEFKPGALEAAERAIILFVDEGLGTYEVVSAMIKESRPCPTKAGVWTYELIKGLFTSRALVGYQCQYGLEFPVFPPVISEERWHQVQVRWENRNRTPWSYDWHGQRSDEKKTKYVATGLMKCVCAGSINKNRGGSLTFKPARDLRNQNYVCGCARRKPNMRHINIQAISVHAFIHGLMATDPHVLFGQFRQTVSYQELQNALNNTERDLLDAEARAAQRRAEIKNEAADLVHAIGFTTTDAGWENLVAAHTDARMAKEDAVQEQSRLGLERSRLTNALAEYVPTEEVADLRERTAQWGALEVWEQNCILLQLFDRWYFRRLNGSDTELEMVMVLRGGRELPPVPVKTIDKTRSIWRRLPTVREWMGTVIAEQQERYLAAAERAE